MESLRVGWRSESMRNIPKMPEEYKGKVNKSGGYTKSPPREWTEKEIRWVLSLKERGYTNNEIAESVGRSLTSTSIKLKRLSKKYNTYNEAHISDKLETNRSFIDFIKPSTICDVYAGKQSVYQGIAEVVSNDKNDECDTAYHLDALSFCCEMYSRGRKFDIVDLDPYGSAYDCFDLAVKMARRGLIITFGELGHKRWKRLDYVRRYYGITNLEDFTLDALINHVKMIGRRNKKELTVYAKREWRNIGRVWFEIRPLKITEQWGTE